MILVVNPVIHPVAQAPSETVVGWPTVRTDLGVKAIRNLQYE